ncbi:MULTISPECIES: alpha/beta hydrolase [Sinorhizobium]|uniref:alpha/beta fold hydrolase n=1 Tax=Sinorhizobium TaxID=28105 RepID=UPI000BE80D7C|nr:MULTISPECIES: alpha/beta hydrolase [Sinorhizobium]PDT51201.1 hypothetical protein CO664_22850 [Sinorhizobium sp. NG07B]POH25853.1 hypothetical protein ATY30_27195 [Sinorhizobium americanum]
MAYATTKDDVEIFYKDWGLKDAQPIVFHHGWPLSSDDWDAQMLAITVPTLVLHGEDDQIVPIADSALKSSKLLKNGTLKTYPGFSHGMLTVNADVLNADLLAFVKA